jgi:hypothetical protein
MQKAHFCSAIENEKQLDKRTYKLITNSEYKNRAQSLIAFSELYTRIFQVCSERWPPLWSNRQTSWLQIQRSRFDSRLYQIFCEAVGLERGPLSLVCTTEELVERKNSGSGLEKREYGRRNPLRRTRDTLYPQKLALTSPTSGGRSVGIVRSRTKATEFSLVKTGIGQASCLLTGPSTKAFHVLRLPYVTIVRQFSDVSEKRTASIFWAKEQPNK